MNPLTYGSLFAGYGGLEMGVQSVLGGKTLWHSENAAAPARVLDRRWPDVPNIGDVAAVDWRGVEPVDVITGGFPCQDVSAAGHALGLAPGTRSGLWSHMAYAVGQLRPALVIIENVRGLLSARATSRVEPCPVCMGDADARYMRALGAVLADLAILGYDSWWDVVRASDVGAPHQRARVFVVAERATNAAGARLQGPGSGQPPGRAATAGNGRPSTADAPDADGAGRGVLGWVEPVQRDPDGRSSADVVWGPYESAVRRWERLTRPAPYPTTPNRDGAPRLAPAFVEWLMGLDAGHVTDPTLGISRTQQLTTLGNGVVPQQAALAVRAWRDWRWDAAA